MVRLRTMDLLTMTVIGLVKKMVMRMVRLMLKEIGWEILMVMKMD